MVSKRFLRPLCLLLLALPLLAQTSLNLLPMDELVKDWTISKQFTLDVAEKMPEAKYNFKATEAEMSFQALMLHISNSHVYRFYQLTGIEPPSWLKTPPKQPSKTDVMRILAESFDYVIAALPKITSAQLDQTFKVGWKGRPEASGRAMMLNMFVHVGHHRAQAEVYLRLNGIEPPIYTF